MQKNQKHFDKKAQGAIEYLLIIGAAILVVAIVILATTGALGTGKNATTNAQTNVETSIEDLRAAGGGGNPQVNLTITSQAGAGVNTVTVSVGSSIVPVSCSANGVSGGGSAITNCVVTTTSPPIIITDGSYNTSQTSGLSWTGCDSTSSTGCAGSYLCKCTLNSLTATKPVTLIAQYS